MQYFIASSTFLVIIELSFKAGLDQAQVWNQDHLGFPINARPTSAIGTLEKVEIAEVLNQIVQRACDFEKPTTATTTTTTTAYRKVKAEVKAKDEFAFEKEVDKVLTQPVVVEAAYPNLVSIINQTNLLAICNQNGYEWSSN